MVSDKKAVSTGKEESRVLRDDAYTKCISQNPFRKHVHLNGVFETLVIIYKGIDSTKRSQRDVEAFGASRAGSLYHP